MGVKKLATAVKEDQLKGAPRAVLEDLFDDFYRHRKQVYWMNFIRGIVFGFGTVIGGTIMVALLLWILSLLNYIPFLEGIVDAAQESLKNRGR
jgi:hypothetical protein